MQILNPYIIIPLGFEKYIGGVDFPGTAEMLYSLLPCHTMTRLKSNWHIIRYHSKMRITDEAISAERTVITDEREIAILADTEVDQNELATLKNIAQLGSFNKSLETTSQELADVVGASTQTVHRRLQALDEAGLLNRSTNTKGQTMTLTDIGRRLLAREYIQYRDLFESSAIISLSGPVIDGAGEGGNFISLEGYMEQFVDALGYEPYAGTLNVKLDEVNVAKRTRLQDVDPIEIDGWESNGRSFGPVACYPATIETVDSHTYGQAHVLVPERTHHGPDQLEVIADVRLREELELETGEVISVHVL